MKKVLLLAALSIALALVLSAPVMAQSTSASAGASAPAQSSACDEVQDRLNASDDSLTSAELLACGLSPEAIDPCEGNPDPNCGANLPEGAYPSINGPNGVGTNNACSGLLEGGTEAVACYEDLIGTASPGASSSASASASASPSASANTSSSASALPETGGPASAFALVPLALLVGTGLLALGVVRRG
ncbi:MAG: hypothetical protein WKF44_06960 [Rubrobacteraceae bacterium]